MFGLSCLTTDYAALWNRSVGAEPVLPWVEEDVRLTGGCYAQLHRPWERENALRTDYERWQALVEFDVLCAQARGSVSQAVERLRLAAKDG